jgi:NAD(P)-dependent dehydrogenase (short-subunit alcohol dehydrogenase family)
VRLKNKVTVITGAGHGIGKACAQRFAKEGAQTSMKGQFVANALCETGQSGWARATDVASCASVEELARETLEQFLANLTIYRVNN